MAIFYQGAVLSPRGLVLVRTSVADFSPPAMVCRKPLAQLTESNLGTVLFQERECVMAVAQ